MKILLFILAFLFSLFLFEGVFAEEPASGTYEAYKKNVDDFCAMTAPEDSNGTEIPKLWSDWRKKSLIKINKIDYPAITDKDPNQKYDTALNALQIDTGKLRTI